MILPQTYFGTLIVMILGMLCAGLWANTYKAAGKMRFEIYYVDFAIGLAIAAVAFAFTFGNLGFDGFSLVDDISQVHKRQWLDAFGAGVLSTLANMFLLAAISVSSMAVAFPVAMGLTLVMGALLGQLGPRASNPTYLYLGCALILTAIVADAIAHKSLVAMRKPEILKSGKRVRGPGAAKGVILSAVSGLLMVGVYPLVHLATTGDVALGPYSVMLFLAGGAFVSTFVFSLFFMNLPVQGEALEITDFLKTRLNRHWHGVLGGILWSTATVAVFVAASTTPEAQVGRATSLLLSKGGPLVAGLCGLMIWKEFADGGGRTKAFVALILFAGGLALIALAFG